MTLVTDETPIVGVHWTDTQSGKYLSPEPWLVRP